MSDQTDLKERLARLSPEQRALLAKRLSSGRAATPSGSYLPIERAVPTRTSHQAGGQSGRLDIYPASHGQQRMWFLHEYAGAVPVYVIPSSFHVKGPFDFELFLASVSDVVRRHDTLRTRFVMEGGELFQHVTSGAEFLSEIRNFEHGSDESKAEAVNQYLEEVVRHRFDLAKTQGFRLAVARLGEEEHVVCFVLHHIISDGWSRSNLWRDVGACYAARAAGTEAHLTPLPVQFADYAQWQQRQFATGSFERMAEYWKNQLAGKLEPLELPSDRARPPKESFAGARAVVSLDSELIAGLTARAREEGATLFMILLAAFKALLFRYTGRDDLLVGVPIANRQRSEVEGLVGFFVNTLVMRTNLSGDPTFRELLSRVKETAIDAYAHQDMPFEKLVEMLHVQRAAGLAPVFQVSFALQDFPAVTMELPGTKATAWSTETHTSKFDFSLAIEKTTDGWTATAEYSTDLFDPDRVERMLGHWRVMLESLVDDPGQRLHTIPLLTQKERHQLLGEWNRNERPYPQDKCLHQLFEDQVKVSPDVDAVLFEGQALSYRDLNRQANLFANHLRGMGVGPEVVVGLCVERSLEMVVGLLGILKAGGAYLPLDPEYPADRLAFMIADSGVGVIVTQEKIQPLLPAAAVRLVRLDADWPTIETQSPPIEPVMMQPENLAYMIYTSGSTGRPKGVMITHRGIVNHMRWMKELFPLEADDRILQKTPFSFDASVWEFYAPLLSGAQLVMASPGGHADPGYLIKTIIAERITQFQAVPSLLKVLTQNPGFKSCRSLRRVFSGGEALTVDLARQICETTGAELHNLYGPTEATIDSTHYPIPGGTIKEDAVPIGRPISNLRAYILDDQLQPVPVGVAGELHIGGTGMARGYHNLPELTAEKFISDPFCQKPGERIYKTGDWARYLPDGNIEYLGRLDEQVKIRGHRIELGEVEAVVSTHPGVQQAAVSAMNEDSDSRVLVAYLVASGKPAPSVMEMRNFLKGKLPEAMIPSRYVVVAALPLSPSGKLDRKALQRLEGQNLSLGCGYLPPCTPLEHELTRIWQSLLSREQIGIGDNFFESGGHSLMAITLCSKIGKDLAIEIPLPWIFEFPTVQSLAERIEIADGKFRTVLPMPLANREMPLPMSFAQEGMWFLQQTVADPSTYNICMAWHLVGPINRDIVRRSLQVIQARHEALRTSLIEEHGNLVQRIEKLCPLPWQEEDFQRLTADQPGLTWDMRLLEEARQAFDLARSPLWRVLWVECGKEEHLFACTFHHSIMDEWSMRMFFQELHSLYKAHGEEEHALLPDLPVQFADFAAWQRQQMDEEQVSVHGAYWRQQLQDLPPGLDLQGDLSEPPRRSGRGACHRFHISGEVAAKLTALSREERATPFMTALAAFQVWLYRYTGQSDLVVATPLTARDRQEVQNLIGCFLNTLPIRSRLEGSEGFRKVLRQVRHTVIEAFEHARFPFQNMVELAVKDRNANPFPLHQVMYVFLEEDLPELCLGEARGRLIPVHTRTSKCDLSFSVMSSEQGWECELEYACGRFSEEAATRLSNHLKEVLESIAESAEVPVDKLRVMPASERHQILVEWNPSRQDYPRDRCVQQLFEKQVERTPEAVAVQSGDVCLSYQEINSRANRLAHHLRSLGIVPDALVGLQVERSVDMIIAVLGILKAGGAYVPLDPKLPHERLRFLLGDIRAPLLICQRSGQERLKTLIENPDSQILIMEELAEVTAKYNETNPPCQNSSSDLAYVMYTSGSTGQPKGVMVPHRGIVRLVIHPNYVDLGPDDVLLQYAPLSFDASTFEIWGSLLNGARLIIPPADLLDLTELGNLITGNGITTLWLTAALFHQMMEQQPNALGKVRTLLSGGDVLSPSRVADYLNMPDHGRLVNGYGPTENTTFTCCGIFDQSSQVGGSVPIGRPISGTRVHILDRRGELVPTGVVGELYAGGDGLARGYLNSPALTGERFVADPFSTDPQARIYRTGDLARWRPDGSIEFMGRADHQIKIRGYRIELGEIEQVLRQCRGVYDVAVIAQQTADGDKKLIAYLVAAGGDQIDAAGLRSELAEVLPGYMIPHNFVILDQLPMGTNGKLDRLALAGLEGVELASGREYVVASTELERRLVEIWQALLGREKVGVHDNFFELGGHSLQAARLAAEIEKLVGHRLPVAAFFQSPTIASLALRITDDEWAPAWSSLVPLQPQGFKPPLFLMHGWGGDVYGFLGLAKCLAPEQPVYGVQAVGLDDSQQRHATVEEMASHYVEEIRALQPEGPYQLCGYSLGGLIAYETAQHLRRQGQHVAVLALLDSTPIGPIPPALHATLLVLRLPGRFLFHAREFWAMPMGKRISYIRGRWYALRNLLVKNRKKPGVTMLPDPETGIATVEKQSSDHFLEATKSYRPAPYSGALDVFVSEESSFSTRFYWQFLARGRAQFHRIPGRHREILSPENLPALAGAFVQTIQRAGRKHRNELPQKNPHANHLS